MQYLILPGFNPAQHLAIEEWCWEHLETFAPDGLILLYRNAPSIIIGKNQNAFREVNWLLAELWNIPVLRRLSGGGAVYHDLNNINYSWLTLSHTADTLSHCGSALYAPPLQWIIETLNPYGIHLERHAESDLFWKGYKVSGNAQLRRGQKILQHGTLLYQCDWNRIQSLLHHNNSNFSQQGTASRRSPTQGIQSGFSKSNSVEFLLEILLHSCQNRGYHPTSLPPNAWIEAKQELQTRYSSWEWNWGRSPQFHWNWQIPGGSLRLVVQKGLVQEASWHTCSESSASMPDALASLTQSLGTAFAQHWIHRPLCLSSLRQVIEDCELVQLWGENPNLYCLLPSAPIR